MSNAISLVASAASKSDAKNDGKNDSKMNWSEQQWVALQAGMKPSPKLFIYGKAATGKTTVAEAIIVHWQTEFERIHPGREPTELRIDRSMTFNELQASLLQNTPNWIVCYDYRHFDTEDGKQIDDCLTGRLDELRSFRIPYGRSRITVPINPYTLDIPVMIVSLTRLNFPHGSAVTMCELTTKPSSPS
jgi:DNA polymerase III delta prime subunit